MSRLTDYLEITEYEWDELDIELEANTGSSGEMIYDYYFKVPESISNKLIKKTGWRRGDFVYVPVWVLDEIDDVDMDWIRENTQKDRFEDFSSDLDCLLVKIPKNQFLVGALELRMIYSYAVTLFEAYLSESAKHVVTNNKQALRRAAHYFSDRSGAHQFKVAQFLDFDIEKYVVQQIGGLTFHNNKLAQEFFSKIFSEQIDFSALDEVIKTRHDIVHRNGKNIQGETIIMDSKKVHKSLALIKSASQNINDKILKLNDVL